MMGFHFKIGAMTDVGRVRAINEDHFSVEENSGLFMVADGLGGQNAGDIASKMAIEIIKSYLNTREGQLGGEYLGGEYNDEFSYDTNRMLGGIQLANSAIYDAGQRNSGQRGMGSTISAVRINGDVISLAHVGDSRIYRIRGGRLERLTTDHSLVQEQLKRGLITEGEAAELEHKNVITRALGAEDTILIDADEEVLFDHDKILLCTDGLTDMVGEGDILRIILRCGNDPQKACKEMVDSANEKGGMDNITVILLHCEKDEGEADLLRRAFFLITGRLRKACGQIPGFLRGQKGGVPSGSGGVKAETA